MSVKNMFYSKNKKFSNTEEKAFARGELAYNVTEDILLALEELGFSKKEFSQRLGKTAAFVTQILGGSRNMTLNTLSDIAYALGAELKISFELNKKQHHKPINYIDYFVEDNAIKMIKVESEHVGQNDSIYNVDFNKNKIINYQKQTEYKVA